MRRTHPQCPHTYAHCTCYYTNMPTPTIHAHFGRLACLYSAYDSTVGTRLPVYMRPYMCTNRCSPSSARTHTHTGALSESRAQDQNQCFRSTYISSNRDSTLTWRMLSVFIDFYILSNTFYKTHQPPSKKYLSFDLIFHLVDCFCAVLLLRINPATATFRASGMGFWLKNICALRTHFSCLIAVKPNEILTGCLLFFVAACRSIRLLWWLTIWFYHRNWFSNAKKCEWGKSDGDVCVRNQGKTFVGNCDLYNESKFSPVILRDA